MNTSSTMAEGRPRLARRAPGSGFVWLGALFGATAGMLVFAVLHLIAQELAEDERNAGMEQGVAMLGMAWRWPIMLVLLALGTVGGIFVARRHSRPAPIERERVLKIARRPDELQAIWDDALVAGLHTERLDVRAFDDGRLVWTFRRPGQAPFTWLTEGTLERPGEVNVWKSSPHALPGEGEIHFIPWNGGSEVTLRMYVRPAVDNDPPEVATLFSDETLDEVLVTFKALAEGQAPR